MSASNQIIKFSEIARIRNGYAFKSKDYVAKGVGLVRQSNLTGNLVDMDDAKYLPSEFLTEYPLFIVNKGDVLIGLSGSIGEPSIYEEDAPALQNQRTGLIIPIDDDPSNMFYIRYLLLFLTNELMGSSKGAGIQNLSAQDIENLPIPFHSQKERMLIVKNLDESFSKIDEGISSLEATERQLELYRQSVLKDAFEGKLTADWRAANPDLVEPTDKLLARIEAERKAAHQAELDAWKDAVSQWEAKGKDGKKPSKPSKPMEMHVSNLGLEIEGWIETKFGCLASSISNGISTKPEGESGVKILKISSVRASELNINEHRYINENLIDKFKFTLKSGDLLFTRYNGSKKFVGVCALYDHEKFGPVVYPDKLIRTRLFKKALLPDYAMLAMSAGASRAYIEVNIRSTAGQHGISGQNIKDTPIPICSLQEQQAIADIVTQAFENAKVQLVSIRGLIKKSTALKQSILKQAFSGHELLEDAS